MLIQSDLGPFEPRFVVKQQVAGNINTIIDAIGMRESNLTEKYNNLLTVAMDLIESQSATVQISLDTLKSSSTTVLILGSTSRELVDRIKNEFFAVNSFLDAIRNDLLPSIQLSSDRIQVSVDSSTNVSQIFSQTVKFVSDQMVKIQTRLVQIATLLINAQGGLRNINNLLRNTSEITIDSYEVRNTIVADSRYIFLKVNDLTSNLQLLQNQTSQLRSLPNCEDKEVLLRELISVSETTQNYVTTDIVGEISNQQEQFFSLNYTLTEEISRFNLLQAQLVDDESSIAYRNERAQFLQTEVYKLVGSVTQQINRAKNILQNLRDFSTNSLRISVQASMLKQGVTSINEIAELAFSESKVLQQNISRATSQVERTQSIIFQTSDLISSVQQVCFSLHVCMLKSYANMHFK